MPIVILTGISIWNLAEVQVGIVAACGPLLRPVLARAFSPLGSMIASRWRGSSKTAQSKDSHDLPRFAKLSESQVNLAKNSAKASSKNVSARSTEQNFEMDSRYDPTISLPGVGR